MTANAYDPGRQAPGVAFMAIDGAAAEAACRAALSDHPDVARFHYQLGRALDRQDRIDDAIAEYEAAFVAGYAIGAQAEGKIFEVGINGLADFAKAAKLYQRALDGGYAYAAGDLAFLHQEGHGFPKDSGEAARLYRVAAEAGDAYSAVNLAILLETGDGIAKDDTEALRWFEKAAATEPRAAFGAGRHYRYGLGTEKDFDKAESFFRTAIASGDASILAQSQNELAWLLATEKRELDEAAELANAALAATPPTSPDRAAVLDTLGWIENLRGDSRRAISDLAEAHRLAPDNPVYLDHLGDVYAANDHPDDARIAWRSAASIDVTGKVFDPEWDRGALLKKLDE
jgi:TPR repeat protein